MVFCSCKISTNTSLLLAVDEKIELSENENEVGLPPIVSKEQEEEKESSYGWLIVLGAFLVQVTSFGTCTSW